jgi:hypothetical protein
MKWLALILLCALCGALGFVSGRASVPAPPASKSCPPPTAECPASAPAAQHASAPKRALASAPVAASSAAPSPAEIATALRGCVQEQRAYSGTSLVLKLTTDATGKVKSADIQGGEFLSEAERRCVRQRARGWQAASGAEEILIHVSL